MGEWERMGSLGGSFTTIQLVLGMKNGYNVSFSKSKNMRSSKSPNLLLVWAFLLLAFRNNFISLWFFFFSFSFQALACKDQWWRPPKNCSEVLYLFASDSSSYAWISKLPHSLRIKFSDSTPTDITYIDDANPFHCQYSKTYTHVYSYNKIMQLLGGIQLTKSSK